LEPERDYRIKGQSVSTKLEERRIKGDGTYLAKSCLS
jgi:hypothetical protein